MIREGKMRSKYFFADPNVIITPPEKDITLPSTDVCFEVSTDQLDKLLKAAAVYQLPDLSAVGEGVLLNSLFVIRRTILPMILQLLLVRQMQSFLSTLRLKISKFFLEHMKL